ncbi:hypothetical protein SAMN05192539_10023 [Paraburkholderia diazotrophica]|uniref:Uncharacterized protein n=2 Tax=Paraburkholderia diazotrophica TaxID=667676 RepID=A0A1H6QZC3_9BURK|nr:hypothetical protein SAMN05192539_10023 [Paraburkholderia diazotrophica]
MRLSAGLSSICIAANCLLCSSAFAAHNAGPKDSPSDSIARYEALAKLPFPGGQPTRATAATLRDELLFQRATQVYLWALPAINLYSMKEGFGEGVRRWL